MNLKKRSIPASVLRRRSVARAPFASFWISALVEIFTSGSRSVSGRTSLSSFQVPSEGCFELLKEEWAKTQAGLRRV